MTMLIMQDPSSLSGGEEQRREGGGGDVLSLGHLCPKPPVF